MRLIDYEAFVKDVEHRLQYNECTKEYAQGARDTLEIAKLFVFERPTGECKTCRHRDPEDKKCDCGEIERQGCPFPVSDDYFCKFYEKGGADMRKGAEE